MEVRPGSHNLNLPRVAVRRAPKPHGDMRAGRQLALQKKGTWRRSPNQVKIGDSSAVPAIYDDTYICAEPELLPAANSTAIHLAQGLDLACAPAKKPIDRARS